MVEYKIDPELKKEINNQGWDDGGAAIIYSSEEERDALLERLETGGFCKNLETYIRMHKKIVVPAEYVSMRNSEKFYTSTLQLRNYIFRDNFGDKSIFFIDSKGNIAGVEISLNKIASYKGSDSDNPLKNIREDVLYENKRITDELNDMGFLELTNCDKRSFLYSVITDYREIKQAEERKKQKEHKAFDF